MSDPRPGGHVAPVGGRGRTHPPVGVAVALLAVALAGVFAGAAAALEVPYLAGRVNDLAGMIPEDAHARIEEKLRLLEEETGAQVAVLTVPSLDGDSLEAFSMRVAETWKLGRAGVDDGVLVLIARDDRKMRIEVGYGLEGVLTDALSGRILDGIMRPRFRAGEFGAGVEEAVDSIAGLIRGDGTLPPPEETGGGIDGMEGAPWLVRLGMFAFFLFVVGMFSLSALFTKGFGAWFLFLFLIPFGLAFPIAILGPIVGGFFSVLWILGFPVGWIYLHLTGRGKDFVKTSSWAKSLASSSGRGWSSSGGWSSGGGFSGGGGSFGGGGGSSSW